MGLIFGASPVLPLKVLIFLASCFKPWLFPFGQVYFTSYFPMCVCHTLNIKYLYQILLLLIDFDIFQSLLRRGATPPGWLKKSLELNKIFKLDLMGTKPKHKNMKLTHKHLFIMWFYWNTGIHFPSTLMWFPHLKQQSIKKCKDYNPKSI